MEVGRLGPSDYFGESLSADDAFSPSQFGTTHKKLLVKTMTGFILYLLFSVRLCKKDTNINCGLSHS